MAERPVETTEGETPKSKRDIQKKSVKNATEIMKSPALPVIDSHVHNAQHEATSKAKSVLKQPRPARTEKPHTVSRPPPEDMDNRPTSNDGNNVPSQFVTLSKIENMMERQNRRFENMMLQTVQNIGLMNEAQYEYDYDDCNSLASSGPSYVADHDEDLAYDLAPGFDDIDEHEGHADPVPKPKAKPKLPVSNTDANADCANAGDGNEGPVQGDAAPPDVHGNQPQGFAARFAGPGDTGPPINENVAVSLNYLLHTSIEDRTMTELYERYPCPNNATQLIVPKVNSTIWESMSSKARSRDLKIQRVQRPLIKGITALARSANVDDSGTQDTLALLANANFELLCLRKELLKPEINTKYAHLCRPTVKPTEFLFGDIGKMVKELDEQHKASAGLFHNKTNKFAMARSRSARGARFNPYQSARYRMQGYHGLDGPFPNAAFLGMGFNRRGMANRRGMNLPRPQHRRPDNRSRQSQTQTKAKQGA